MSASQCDLILRLMRERGSVTAREAMVAGAGMRLAARISDLKEAGHVIEDEWETEGDARFKRYRLVEKPEQASIW